MSSRYLQGVWTTVGALSVVGLISCRTGSLLEPFSSASPQAEAGDNSDDPTALPQPSNLADFAPLAIQMQQAYQDFLNDPDSHHNPDMVAVAVRIMTMDLESIEQIFADRSEFAELQRDINSLASRYKNQSRNTPSTPRASPPIAPGIIGQVPWDSIQQMPAEVTNNPFSNIITGGKILVCIGISSVIAGYFLKLTNQAHPIISYKESLEKSQELHIASRTAEELDLKAGLGKSPLVNERPFHEEDFPAEPTTLPKNLQEIIDRTPHAEERFKGSKIMRKVGLAAAIMGAILTGAAEMSSTYYGLVDGENRKIFNSYSPSLATLLTRLAAVEEGIMAIYART